MAVKRFYIRTYGCQMNVHDSEKVANLLFHDGWRDASSETEADLLLINTCSIRDKAEQRLYSDLGELRRWKEEVPSRVLGVGGCVAQQAGHDLLERFEQLDFAFGTHNLRMVPDLAEAALAGQRRTRIELSADPIRFDFPDHHPDFSGSTPGRSFVTVMEGCDMFCSFCIVPVTRGREISRSWQEIVDEVASLAGNGTREVTLLGQTVNAYGRHDLRKKGGSVKDAIPFARLLERIAAISGIERIRYTSPHPLFFDADLIRAHGELEELCPHVHLPAQSGSDRILEKMRRRYDSQQYRRIVEDLRSARPDIAITTDLIVGFPGESEHDFDETLQLVQEVGFTDSFSFKYSPRPGTRAADLLDQVAPLEAQHRLERLQLVQRGLTFAAHRARVGQQADVLVTGPSRHGGKQLQGRDPYNRVVNFTPKGLQGCLAGGDTGSFVSVRIDEATPHSLIGTPTLDGQEEGAGPRSVGAKIAALA